MSKEKENPASNEDEASKKEESAEETADEPKEDKDDSAPEEESDKEVPEKFKDLVSTIEEMSVLELSELVEVLEDTFGVSAAQPMMMAGGAAAGGGEGGEEEQSSFNVELSAVGDQKINVIKVIREVTELSLKDAKDMVDNAPSVIREGVEKEQADEIKSKLEDAGATVSLK